VACSPLCAHRGDGQRTLWNRAKVYPAPRHLAVLKGLGEQGVVASACWAQVGQESEAGFAHRPAVTALVERLVSASKQSCVRGGHSGATRSSW
jgi:hypothetical protein